MQNLTPAEVIALHWICECGQSAENVKENAEHVVRELTAAGYTIVHSRLPLPEPNPYLNAALNDPSL